MKIAYFNVQNSKNQTNHPTEENVQNFVFQIRLKNAKNSRSYEWKRESFPPRHGQGGGTGDFFPSITAWIFYPFTKLKLYIVVRKLYYLLRNRRACYLNEKQCVFCGLWKKSGLFSAAWLSEQTRFNVEMRYQPFLKLHNNECSYYRGEHGEFIHTIGFGIGWEIPEKMIILLTDCCTCCRSL